MVKTGTMSRTDVAAFVCKLRLAGFKVIDYQTGFACEVNGEQVFSACDQGNERYNVKRGEAVAHV